MKSRWTVVRKGLSISVFSDKQKICIIRSENNYYYELYSNNNGAWCKITRPNSFLPYLNEYLNKPEVLKNSENETVIKLVSSARNISAETQITFSGNSDWIHFKSVADLPEGKTKKPPEVLLDLGSLPPYDRGHYEWMKISIENPTVNYFGTRGNDFPALYYWDKYINTEVMMYFNIESMTWLGNYNRFLNYKFGLKRTDKKYYIGMQFDGDCGLQLAKDRYTFEYWVKLTHRQSHPSEIEAINSLSEDCLDLFSRIPDDRIPQKNNITWETLSYGLLGELKTKKQLFWIKHGKNEGLIPYVRGTSKIWPKAIRKKTDKPHPAITSNLGVLEPLTLMLRTCNIKDKAEYENMADKLYNSAKQLYLQDTDNLIGDIWTRLLVLFRMVKAADAYGDKVLLKKLFGEINRRVIPFASGCNYLFPLFLFPGKRIGYNVSSVGFYSYLMIILHEITGEKKYLEETEKSLRTLYNLPPNLFFHEPFCLSHAAYSAKFVYTRTRREEYLDMCRYFTSQNVRMFYLYNDRTKKEFYDYDTKGMIQACGSIQYPALFENVLTILPFSSVFKAVKPRVSFLKLLNYTRLNSVSFYPAVFEKGKSRYPSKFVPLENLQMLENREETGSIGQEIYGAGETLWMYLLFEAFCRADDENVMAMNLDVFDYDFVERFKSGKLNFLIYNPNRECKSVKLELKTKNKIKTETVDLKSENFVRM